MPTSKVTTIIFTTAALIATVGTISLNVTHGWLAGGLVAAIVFGTIDAFNVMVVSLRRWTLAYVPLALAGLCLAVISTLAITDFFAERLGANAADEVAASTLNSETNTKRQLIVDEMKSLADERKTVSWAIRTSEQVKAEIEAKKLDPLWSATGECTTNLSGPKSRTLCVQIARLRGEFNGSKRSEDLSAMESAAREKLSMLPSTTPLEATDRVTRLLVKLWQIDKHPIHQIALALALIVEAITVFFPMVASKPAAAPAAAPAALATTASQVKPKRSFNPRPKLVRKPAKVAGPSATVIPMHRQPLAVVGNPSAATPASSSVGPPTHASTWRPLSAPSLPSPTATPNNP